MRRLSTSNPRLRSRFLVEPACRASGSKNYAQETTFPTWPARPRSCKHFSPTDAFVVKLSWGVKHHRSATCAISALAARLGQCSKSPLHVTHAQVCSWPYLASSFMLSTAAYSLASEVAELRAAVLELLRATKCPACTAAISRVLGVSVAKEESGTIHSRPISDHGCKATCPNGDVAEPRVVLIGGWKSDPC